MQGKEKAVAILMKNTINIKQIDIHMQRIKAHTLEQFLLRLAHMHETVKSKK